MKLAHLFRVYIYDFSLSADIDLVKIVQKYLYNTIL